MFYEIITTRSLPERERDKSLSLSQTKRAALGCSPLQKSGEKEMRFSKKNRKTAIYKSLNPNNGVQNLPVFITIRKLNFSRIAIGWFAILMLIGAAFGQSTRNTDHSPDNLLKSNARVNPSTLAMEMSVPIGGYIGRAGHSLPITFNYSSKLWQFRTLSVHNVSASTGIIEKDVIPTFAKHTASGWTSSLSTPQIEYRYDMYRGKDVLDNEGVLWTLGEPVSEDPSTIYDIYYIKRLYVNLPDGSSHEFRASNTPIDCGDTGGGCTGQDFTGTFLSVDGSKMRLESGTSESTLYMPDGSRYIFGSDQGPNIGSLAHTYIDRHGNKMTFDNTNKQWTDTLGRILSNPIPSNYGLNQDQTVGDHTVTFPGMNGGTTNVTLSWRYLKDPNGGESGFENPSQSLSAIGGSNCHQTYPTPVGTPLFANGNDFAICNYVTANTTGFFNPVVLTKITYPNGSSYQFKYNIYGEIEKIIYPSGGYERFAYGTILPVQAVEYPYDLTNRGVTDRWVSAKGDGTDETHWNYSATRGANPYKITTTNPDGTKTEQLLYDEPFLDQSHRPYGFDNVRTGRPFEDRVYSTTNQLLRRHLTQYETTDGTTGMLPGFPIPVSWNLRSVREINITFEPGATSALVTMSETTYDSNGDLAYFASLNPKTVKNYNYISLNLSTAQTANIETIAALFSSSNLAQTSETDYLYDASYKARNIVTLPIETRVKNAAGNIVAKSQVAYDESAYGIISAGTDTQWTDPGTTVRGNPTTSRSWTDIANNQYIETHAQFDNFGNARKAWDARGNLSEVEYSSTYKYAYPTKTISSVPDSTGTNGASTAFETTSVYDLNTGLVLSTTDANGQTSTMEYNDALLRPTKVIPPTGGAQTVMEYTDTPGAMKVVTKTQIDATNWAESTVYADGLGRSIKSEKKDAAGNVFTETEYDSMGRVKKATNPYRTGDTKLWTENTYDDLSRVTKVKTPDNAEVTTAYAISTSGTLGTVVTVTDQAGKQRRSLTNGLGQLVRVDEPNDAGSLGTIASPVQSTAYSYDTLNNLVTVNQGAQTRTFQYDSLSRLKQATNPESGTISYAYDANGNLTGKTDARSIVTTYAYDNLNRVKTRSYSDSTPAVAYNYDGTGLGSVPNYAKGKLTKVSSSVSETKYNSFDNLGKILSSSQVTDGQTYTFGYAYNLAGMLTEETYPSGRKVKNTIAPDASLSKVETMPSGGSYATRAESFAYTAAGAVSAMQLGNGKWENAQFNSRLQPTQLGLGTSATDQSLWKVAYDYGTTDNNGNVKQQTISVPSMTPLEQNYTYDSLNRIKSASEKIQNASETWKQTFTYDRYGNRNFDAANTTTLGSCSTNQCNPSIDAANNRFTTNQGYTYDLSGNITQEANGKTYSYDALNKQIEAKDNNGNIVGQYFYDGLGKRIKKQSASENTTVVYDALGSLVAEYALSSIQASTNLSTTYLTDDTLGNPRIVTDQAGNVQSRRDFMPFGEEIVGLGNRSQTLGYQNNILRQGFTGYEKDTETDLEFAQNRYYSSKSGRFTSVDPLMKSATLFDPQSFNRYSYVSNNPVNLTDSLGLMTDDGCNPKKKPCPVPAPNILTPSGDGVTVTTGTFTTVPPPKGSINPFAWFWWGVRKGYESAKRGLGWSTEPWNPPTMPAPNPDAGTGDAPTDSDTPPDWGGGSSPDTPDAGGGESSDAKTRALILAYVIAKKLIEDKVEEWKKGGKNPCPCLIRFGEDDMEKLKTDAENAEAKGYPYGVSTKYVKKLSGSDKKSRWAPLAEVQGIFVGTRQTGNRPDHYTVVFPAPVNQKITDTFNSLFTRR